MRLDLGEIEIPSYHLLSCPNFSDKEVLRQVPKPVPGSLVVEPYSWKKVAASSPMLKIRTTGVKAVALTLPPG